MDSQECILVVDDDEGLRKSLALILKKKGYVVESAATGKEALAKAGGRPVHLTLLDIKLPDIEGILLLAPLKKTNPDMSVIMITGFASVESAVQSLTAGASGYITKPIDLDGMLARIKTALDHQHLVTEVRQAAGDRERASLEIFDLYNNAPCGYHSLDKDGVFININDTELSWLGCSREEIIGRKKFPDIITEKSRDVFLKNFPVFKEQGWIHDLEFDMVRKDGTILPVLLSATAIKNPDGSLVMSRSTIFDITEHKRAEEALRESELRYRSLFENMLEGFAYCRMLYDKGGRPTDFIYINVNPAFNRIIGTSVVVGKPVTEVFHGIKEAFPELFEIYGRVVLTGEPESFDLDFVPSKKWLHISVYALAKDHFVAIFEDITERKRAEEALRESEHEFHSLAEAMPQIVWVTRPDGWNIYFNQQWVDYTGLTLEESYGHGWNTPFHPDDQQRASDAWQKATVSGGIYALECRLRRADGAYLWWLIRGVPLRDTEGNILKWFGTCTDIEAIKRAEVELARKHEDLNAAYEQLTASEEELQMNYADLATSQSSLRETTNYLNNLLDYANAPIIVWDPSQRITRFNHAFERLTGRTSDEVLGQPLEILFPPQSRENSLELIKKTIIGERWETVDIPILHVNGSIRTVLWNSATLLADDQTTVIATIAQGQDITERKRAEDALLRVNQKLNVITNLTRQDLIGQIFVLKSYLVMTKKNAVGQERILEGIQKCENVILSINDITEFTKDFEDMGVKPAKWQNVKMVLLFGLSHISIGKIQHSLETENLEIFADPLLEKVCQSLFENSVKHGEHVTRIRVWHTITLDGVTIFFEDDGVGIPKEKKEQIFFRGEGTVRVSMRNLIFVRDILDITGITISETGEPGKGARFEMTVPKGAWRTTGKGD